MDERVVVFIDYQNTYKRAHELFSGRVLGPGRRVGQIDPFKLGTLLTGRYPRGAGRSTGQRRVLEQVRVYRGMPRAERDPVTAAACKAECDAWKQNPWIHVVNRPLRYPRNYPRNYPAERPQEKGIDVMLAVDFLHMALEDKYDVGIIVSSDTDLLPSIEAVMTMPATRHVRCEVAAWRRCGTFANRLSLPGQELWCHYLDERDYLRVHDDTRYAR